MSGKDFNVIAVDGGAASGKSSTSKLLAKHYNWLHVDTGSHYRALTLCLLEQGVKLDDKESLRECLAQLDLQIRVDGQEAFVSIDDVVPDSEQMRSARINDCVSYFAAEPLVRERLLDYQRAHVEFARTHGFTGVIMEGRDIGTVVLSNADHKFFFRADAATRQRRRQEEGRVDSIQVRDQIDSGREIAPLTCPEDATVVDTSLATLEEVFLSLCDQIGARIHGAGS